MSGPSSGLEIEIALVRQGATPLSDQIYESLRTAIMAGRLAPGTRLPSWRDLAAQQGVARGTVRVAYERLSDELLIRSAGAAGTFVAASPAPVPPTAPVRIARPLEAMLPGFSLPPLPFQMGVPAQDAFPAKLWARIRMRAVRADAMGPTSYPDPRGQPDLRAQIAAYLAVARGIHCVADQVIVTSGYRGGLALTIQALGLAGRSAWMEEPGFPITRKGLELAGMTPVPIPVDAEGLDVAAGIERAPAAALAVVTPGQQAPTGVRLSDARRRALLLWAKDAEAWIVEDDYLSELQLAGRAGPALAAGDVAGRVIHIGTFSKTLSPSLGLGFLVAPPAVAEHFGAVAACLSPAPNPTTQLAVAGFLADGHYLRHLRHMKLLYAARHEALRACLGLDAAQDVMAGLAIMLRLPPEADDVAIAHQAMAKGLGPVPLSPWYADPARRSPGLLLGVTNLREGVVERACASLRDVLGPSAGQLYASS